jgi:hypothetical protein
MPGVRLPMRAARASLAMARIQYREFDVVWCERQAEKEIEEALRDGYE